MDELKLKLWMPVTKNAETGEYFAALSDDSIDRDEEAMSKSLIYAFSKNASIKALANHENKMQSWVGGWNELKVVEKDGNTALFAKPWFFSKDANPLAAQVQKQVDEALAKGECPGISIGAIIKDYEMQKINGHDIRVFTKGELLEATWVPIQSNRNATYGHIAKKFGMSDLKNKDCEGNNMSDTYTQKDVDSAVNSAKEELTKKISSVEKQLVEKDAEIEKLKKEVEEAKEEADEKVSDAESKAEDSEKKYEAEKKKSLEKAKIVSEMETKLKATSVDMAEVEKEMATGKLPISTYNQ